jgi:hypothetical protein
LVAASTSHDAEASRGRTTTTRSKKRLPPTSTM